MRLTRFITLGVSTAFLASCGGGTNQAVSSGPEASGATTTVATVPSLAERAQLFAYDDSAPLGLKVKKKSRRAGIEVDDVVFDAADRHVAAYLVRPKSTPRAAVLWAHWFAEEPNANRTEFLPDALALAKKGVVSLLPQGFFPWTETLTGKADADRQLAIDQVVQLRRALDVLAAQSGEGVPVGFVGHDYGAMFGSLLVADGRPKAYVFMAPDATFANWFIKYFVRGASATEYQEAFAPLDPVNYVGEAAPASVLFQFAMSDRYVPGYIADKLSEAASDPKKTESYESGHELDDAARRDRLAWLGTELGLSGS
jgi:hypothetical protein